MAKYETLPNAPITEAILDIQTSLPAQIALSDLQKLYDRIKKKYPEEEQRVSFESQIKLALAEKKSTTTGMGKIDGYRFRSPIEGKVVQSRLDGFTFNKLKPYESWELFSTEARKMWEYYREVASPVRLNRVSLRFINRIIIPFGTEIGEYFLTVPEISQSLPQVFRSFFLRLEVPDERNISIGIIQMANQPADENGLPIIFDIDAIRNIDILPSDDKLWQCFGELRDFKNHIFFNSLTHKALEMFK